MGAFEYAALDDKGRERKGVLEGDAPRQIRQQLREKGWVPLDVKPVKQRTVRKSGGGFALSFGKRASSSDVAMITRQLATLIRSGIPVEEALGVTSQQTGKPHLESMLASIRARVLEGHGLSLALSEYPQAFSEMYRATVSAGEQSGHLDVILERLADYAEGQQQIGQKMILALIYPAVLTTVALLAVMFLTAYVVPQVVEVFTSLKQELPPLTRLVIFVSDMLRGYGIYMIILVFLAVMMFRSMMKVATFRKSVHHFLLRMPLIGKMIKGVNTAAFARTCSTLLASGVPALEALHIGGQVITNIPMREAVEVAARQVREGTSLKVALQGTGYFPALMIHLVASGEASGRLDEMLLRSAESQERELETTRAAMLGVFEPLLILVMGGMVLVIVTAILMPILDLNTLIK